MDVSTKSPLEGSSGSQKVPSSGPQQSPPIKAPKIIDKSYVTHEVFRQVGDTFSFNTTPGINMYKWAVLRNSLEQGDLIQIGDLRKYPELQPENEENQPQLAVGHLKNYLKMLRLEPEAQNPSSIRIDVTSLFNKISSQDLMKKFPNISPEGDHYILPCKQNPLLPEGNLPQDLQGVTDMTKQLPYELVGMIARDFMNEASYMNENEVGSKKIDFEQRKQILAHLEDLCNKKALDALQTLLTNYQNGLVFPDNNPLTDELISIRERVTSLDLSGCRLPHNVLLQIATFFPNLKSLTFNEVNENILQQLHSFPKLESLKFKGTLHQFTSQELANLPKTLKRLVFEKCRDLITGNHEAGLDNAIAGLKDFEKLEELVFEDSWIQGVNFSRLPTSLKRLHCLDCSELKDEAITGLNHCIKLEELKLRGNYGVLTGKDFDKLPSSLKRLHCQWIKALTDASIAKLKHCKNLEELRLVYSQITDDIIETIKDFKNLKKLDLSSSQVTGKDLDKLSPSLESLRCDSCSNLKDDAIARLKVFEHLRELSVVGSNLTGENFQMLPISLQNLNCRNCRELTNNALAALSHCTHLQYLDLSGVKVTEQQLNTLPKSAKIIKMY
jgi:hypothetical protein